MTSEFDEALFEFRQATARNVVKFCKDLGIEATDLTECKEHAWTPQFKQFGKKEAVP